MRTHNENTIPEDSLDVVRLHELTSMHEHSAESNANVNNANTDSQQINVVQPDTRFARDENKMSI